MSLQNRYKKIRKEHFANLIEGEIKYGQIGSKDYYITYDENKNYVIEIHSCHRGGRILNDIIKMAMIKVCLDLYSNEWNPYERERLILKKAREVGISMRLLKDELRGLL